MVTKFDFFDGECHAQKGHGDYVKDEDYEALKAERDALAVENAAQTSSLKALAALNNRLWQWTSRMSYNASYVGEPEGMVKGHIREMEKILDAAKVTPATDAALAAIEARGVEKFAQRMQEKMEGLDPIKLPAYAEEIDHLISQLYAFAAELREAK